MSSVGTESIASDAAPRVRIIGFAAAVMETTRTTDSQTQHSNGLPAQLLSGSQPSVPSSPLNNVRDGKHALPSALRDWPGDHCAEIAEHAPRPASGDREAAQCQSLRVSTTMPVDIVRKHRDRCVFGPTPVSGPGGLPCAFASPPPHPTACGTRLADA